MKMKNLVLHVILNSHLDPVWLWSRAQGEDAAIATAGSYVACTAYKGMKVAGQVAGRAEGNLNCTANSLTVDVKRLLRVLKTDMGINEIMTKIRLSSRTHLRKSALTPASELGLVEMTQPDSPRSPTQKYRLTAKGRAAINNNEHN